MDRNGKKLLELGSCLRIYDWEIDYMLFKKKSAEKSPVYMIVIFSARWLPLASFFYYDRFDYDYQD